MTTSLTDSSDDITVHAGATRTSVRLTVKPNADGDDLMAAIALLSGFGLEVYTNLVFDEAPESPFAIRPKEDGSSWLIAPVHGAFATVANFDVVVDHCRTWLAGGNR